MIYLYLKSHNKTGLKYLGQTTNDVYKYKGSGLYWKSHIKKHGYDVQTDILLATKNVEEIRDTGLFFSKLWNIVESNDFANLKEESGNGNPKGIVITESTKRKMSIASQKMWDENPHYKIAASKRAIARNSGNKHSEETKKKIGVARKGKLHTEEAKRKMSKSRVGKSKPYVKGQREAVSKGLKAKYARDKELGIGRYA